MIPKSVAVDFDKTICDSDYPAIHGPKVGVVEALQRIRGMGYQIVIWSCRTCDFYAEVFAPDGLKPPLERPVVRQMEAFLQEHNIPFDVIDDGRMGKPFCDYYIDDKAIRFEDNWGAIADFIAARHI